jgi:predicted DNA-binding transcriptional regulator AlpA
MNLSGKGLSRMETYSTRQAAEKLGISFTSMNRYIADKKIAVPPLTKVGSLSARVWTDADIERVRALLPKIANGRKTRYKKQAQKKQATRKAKR